MRLTKKEKAERQVKAVESLRDWLQPGDTVYCVLRNRARSGMSRSIGFLVATMSSQLRYPDWHSLTPEKQVEVNYADRERVSKPGIVDISWRIAQALDYPFDQERGGVKVSGCGMDMGFHVVNSLSYTLHGRDGAGGYRGGYTLRSEWL